MTRGRMAVAARGTFGPALLSMGILFLGSCTEPEDTKRPAGNGKSSGTFLVSLVPASLATDAETQISGLVQDGEQPPTNTLKETAKTGPCRVLEVDPPLCSPRCASGSICVATNTCQAFPRSIGAGKVTVTGVKLKSGASSFSMDPLNKNYSRTSDLAFPPFAEGDVVTFSAAGDTGIGAFSVSAKGIPPLEVITKDISLADGQPVKLDWKAPGITGNSKVHVEVDISHHGGLKGLIECEAPDNGNLVIDASLVDKLKALGVAGWPKLDIARQAVGTNDQVHVELKLESIVSLPLTIPGITSCFEDADCPDGGKCQQDMKCGR